MKARLNTLYHGSLFTEILIIRLSKSAVYNKNKPVRLSCQVEMFLPVYFKLGCNKQPC